MAYGAADMPLTPGKLERFRLRLRKRDRPSQVGGHLRRRQGDSLEFREFRKFLPGDDARRIDWRASARFGGKSDYLVRTFHAEDRLQLAISLDLRDTMTLPEALPKRLLAIWTAAALAFITLRQGDRVVVYPLQGPLAPLALEPERERSPASIARKIDESLDRSCDEHAALRLPDLQPRHVWIVLSDFYVLDETLRRLRRAVVAAQRGYGWVQLVDFDSWPLERALLVEQERRVLGPGVGEDDDLRLNLSRAQADEVGAALERHKSELFRGAGRGGLDRVHWTIDANSGRSARDHFAERFLQENCFARLFERTR